MLTLVAIVFVAVFSLSVLLMTASRTDASKQSEQTMNVLQAALAVNKTSKLDQIVDIRKQELLSALPWLNSWLLKLEIAPRVRTLLLQADLKWTAGGLLLMCALFFAVSSYLIYLRTGVAIISLLIGLLLGAAPFAYVFYKRGQRFDKFEEGLPEVLDLMVSALRAGHSLVSALDLAAAEAPDPIGSEFRICFDEQNYGLELKTAMNNLAARVPLQDLKIVITAILIQKESGGNLAEVFDKAAYVIRERFRLKRQVRVHTAQGRITGWILTFLPVVLGTLLYLINPSSMSLLWTRAIGIKLLYTSGAMTIIGGLIIRKIVNMDV
jgi:tight adherence protein B